ncbi:hypothetical protein CLTEP_16050 [Clostridium tepidiprofundi DSM 19306]|uniref:Uncharacterized protein n=1 Tax=Clostridium tepidiprofundi DSM 19306 TaxID=1121338 RepID=A0A151B3T8_9CLOT|nr:hypothetical protein [Clostridium tepidiprofundi]KYH34453.1 hypothetical protein CLTEP_16050 [Clostridium tepidiprofundi DSM 19306]
MKRFMGVSLSLLIVIGALFVNTNVNAEMPPGTVVVGEKAFDLNYLMNPTSADKSYILSYIIQAKEIYVKDYAGKWVRNSDNSLVDDIEKVIPKVTYKNVDGDEVTYDKGDGNVIEEDEFYVVNIY